MKKKFPFRDILYVWFPKYIWIALVLALILYSFGGFYTETGALLLNYIAFYIFGYIAVFIHEAGHIIFAKLAGAKPIRIELGSDYYMYGLKIKDFKIVMKSNFNVGFAYSVFEKPTKIKKIISSSGGFLMNFLVVAIIYLLFGFSFEFHRFVPLTDFAMANLLLGLLSFVPFTYNKRKNDALNILRLILNKEKLRCDAENTMNFLQAVDYYEEKEYEKAIPFYLKLQNSKDYAELSSINLAVCYSKLNKTDESLEILQTVSDNLPPEKIEFKRYICNNIAWNYLLKNQAEKALEYAQKAYELDAKNTYVAGTYAGVLTELGEYEKAGRILVRHIDLGYYREDTFIKVLYLVYIYRQMGESKRAKKYMKYIRKHRDKPVGSDHKLIYERLMERIQ